MNSEDLSCEVLHLGRRLGADFGLSEGYWTTKDTSSLLDYQGKLSGISQTNRKISKNDPRKGQGVALLIKTLQTFWEWQIFILIIAIFVGGFQISRFPDSRISRFLHPAFSPVFQKAMATTLTPATEQKLHRNETQLAGELP